MKIFQDKSNPDYKPKKPLWILLAICVLAMAWDYAYGYELPDRFRKWNVESIDVWYNTEGCGIRTDGLWHRAASKWDVLSVVERGEHEYIGYDNRPTLYCAESDPAAIVSLPRGVELRIDYVRDSVDNLILGSAHSYWVSGALVDCDVRLHPAYVTDSNVEEAMLHEFGHCLGIIHSLDPESIMYYSLLRGEASLHADDLLARCELYGKCSQWDNEYNLVIEPFQYKGVEEEFRDKCYYGYLIAGGIWPSDVKATETECD